MTEETVTSLVPPTAGSAAEPLAAADPPTPRIRWAGIVWGAVVAVLAAVAIWVLSEASGRMAIRDRLLTLSPADLNPGWVIGAVAIAAGLLLVILGGVALLRRAQLRA